jgi:hypothetical protein
MHITGYLSPTRRLLASALRTIGRSPSHMPGATSHTRGEGERESGRRGRDTCCGGGSEGGERESTTRNLLIYDFFLVTLCENVINMHNL